MFCFLGKDKGILDAFHIVDQLYEPLFFAKTDDDILMCPGFLNARIANVTKHPDYLKLYMGYQSARSVDQQFMILGRLLG